MFHSLFRRAGFLSVLFLNFLSLDYARAGSATWTPSQSSVNWNDPLNWAPRTVPNSPTDTATFATPVYAPGPTSFSDIELNSMVFTSLNGYVITVGDPTGEAAATLTLSGSGIESDVNTATFAYQYVQVSSTLATNSSPSILFFKNGASVTPMLPNNYVTLYANGGTASGFVGGQVQFLDSSRMDSFTGAGALAGQNGGGGGAIIFSGNSSANGDDYFTEGAGDTTSGAGTIIFEDQSSLTHGYCPSFAGVLGASGGRTFFLGSSSIGTAVLAVFSGFGEKSGRGGGGFIFSDSASAGNASLVGEGIGEGDPGLFQFLGDSSGGTAKVSISGNTMLDLSSHNAPGITIGSLERGGTIDLGANTLTVGSANLSSEFQGVIQGAGSFAKIGTGVLTLSTTNIYTGGTTVSDGVLRVSSPAGSGTGTGPVNVNGGSLGGTGMIAGEVTIAKGAVLSPSAGTTGIHLTNHKLTIRGPLIFDSGSIYSYRLILGQPVIADEVSANGAAITQKAHFVIAAKFHQRLSRGTVFTALDNTSDNPIAGTFINLPDGAIVNVNGNNLQASYEGGDGNDLTLTAVP